MKVLLQHMGTAYYFSASGGWLGDIAQGRAFADLPLAFSFCREHAMFSTNVILAFDDTDLNVSLRGPRLAL
jgi:hypothetical protein